MSIVIVSMKRETHISDAPNSNILEPVEADKEEFPWGLRLSLDAETIEKLGNIKPEVGSTITISADAKVVEVREEAGENVERSIQLQITAMGIGDTQERSQAERVYPKGES
jgi:hypothetical protein